MLTIRPALCSSLCLVVACLLACDNDPDAAGEGPAPGRAGGAGVATGGSGGRGGPLGIGDAATGGAGGSGTGGGSVEAGAADAMVLDGIVDQPPAPDGDTAPNPDGAPEAAIADASAADGSASASQTPPQGRRQLDAWLAAGHYKAWKCEPMVMGPRTGSPHGPNRICSNDLASGHGAGPYPVGAASVKEIYYGARIGVYAVSVKISPGTTGNAWYWYEQNDLEGVGASGCVGCHSRAQRTGGNDYVYVQVK